jgi:hypothetical protein
MRLTWLELLDLVGVVLAAISPFLILWLVHVITRNAIN